MLVDNVSF